MAEIVQQPDPRMLVALSASEMPAVQTRAREFVAATIDRLEEQHREALQNVVTARESGWNAKPFAQVANRLRRSLIYYRKVESALDEGYVIVPPFPGVDVFAIRTNKVKPREGQTTRRWDQHRQQSESPPECEGSYVSAVPEVWQRNGPDEKGNEITMFFAKEWRDVDFPVRMVKPEVIEATSRAMALGIFDDIGILPQSTRSADPIIIGRIHDKARRDHHIAFFIAWFLDPTTI